MSNYKLILYNNRTKASRHGTCPKGQRGKAVVTLKCLSETHTYTDLEIYIYTRYRQTHCTDLETLKAYFLPRLCDNSLKVPLLLIKCAEGEDIFHGKIFKV